MTRLNQIQWLMNDFCVCFQEIHSITETLAEDLYDKGEYKTRMHSSRMLTVPCNGRLILGGGVCPGGECLPRGVYTSAPLVDRQTPVKI